MEDDEHLSNNDNSPILTTDNITKSPKNTNKDDDVQTLTNPDHFPPDSQLSDIEDPVQDEVPELVTELESTAAFESGVLPDVKLRNQQVVDDDFDDSKVVEKSECSTDINDEIRNQQVAEGETCVTNCELMGDLHDSKGVAKSDCSRALNDMDEEDGIQKLPVAEGETSVTNFKCELMGDLHDSKGVAKSECSTAINDVDVVTEKGEIRVITDGDKCDDVPKLDSLLTESRICVNEDESNLGSEEHQVTTLQEVEDDEKDDHDDDMFAEEHQVPTLQEKDDEDVDMLAEEHESPIQMFKPPPPPMLLPLAQRRDLDINVRTYKPSARNTLTREEVCFICYGSRGDLVICGHTGCPKAYHSSCINLDEEFFRAEGGWKCDHHLCSKCGCNQVKQKCYTCTYSVCARCVEPEDAIWYSENEGFCSTCKLMIESLRLKQRGTNEREVCFKNYWLTLNISYDDFDAAVKHTSVSSQTLR